ncbi:outer membrane protein assembly factor BamC [Pseudoalteromonas tunicata]|uniref:Putative lipoprotein-34 NlpB n=1 Tax=Pseudoalteromonas tunicata D2 TaxID=87626 RepID=A4CBC3_9GAMM|nr:outer membrane protein assembly factor BamC [Pseudoalteromonas tunicata]ATC94215.1 outer membrane protein assembly factor BamC [Pseudoalteromonas tunicata]AXT29974.1 outer membrane protein assembly factor BamC [Pseudoalteromonas tunicata]EAR27660.1 putative lipoprotein-34 NlpB [Pseudoalteromonas tunicata D2]MDP4983029.1 outer membrane protein assembly factor BamC [Pseudoalteromonas tunicata]MDP5211443.1 outer membrane protein assembly factor BamC [Pseudoalteromonas tunicata]
MQYWIRNTLVLSVIAGLSGCSVFTNDAHHEKNYRVSEPLKVPANLTKPYQDPEYAMEPKQYQKVSARDSLKPPAQALNIASGSWVEEGDKIARIFFDKPDGVIDLKAFLWQSLQDLITEYQAAPTASNEAAGTLETDWYALTKPEDVWFWQTQDEVSKQRFAFNIEQKEHQRTASMTVTLLDYQSKNEPLTGVLKQQLEVAALNSFVTQYDFNYRQFAIKQQQERGLISLNMGFDNKGNASLVTEQEYLLVFERFTGLLESLNFAITELDDKTGLIAATYDKPDASVWDSIWGDDLSELPLESGKYQILIEKLQTGGTSLTWMDGEGETLEPGTMNDLQQALVKVLRKKGVDI